MTGEVFLERYEALRLLGEGGMGRVYLGRQIDNGREIVIKVMHKKFAADPRFRQAFQREMKMMTRFRHPFAVTCFDASVEDTKNPCIIMEFVPGVTLSELVETHGRLPALRAGMLLGQLGQVLQAAHENGIVHRDLTPVNVMVMNPGTEQETVKVMDFGLASMTAGSNPYISLEKLTGKEPTIGGGTPDFVPPEQVRGEEVDHRGDIYSVGVLLFKVLTGYLPFEKATTTQEILKAQVESQPPRFAELGVGQMIPAAIEFVVRSCLAKKPSDRPQSAMDLVVRYEKALGRKILQGEPVKASMLSGLDSEHPPDPRSVIEHLEAWMPEPIAVVKLRGFAQDMGGEFVDSEPGLISFRIPDPTVRQPTPPKDLFSVLGFRKKVDGVAEHILLELQMKKKDRGTQNVLEMTVMMKPQEKPDRLDDPVWRDCCQQLSRQLKAYLMSR